MNYTEKIKALIDAYIELAQESFYDDAQITDSLTDIFSKKEMEELGYAEFIRAYFEGD